MNKILCCNCCQGKLTKEKIRRPQAQQKTSKKSATSNCLSYFRDSGVKSIYICFCTTDTGKFLNTFILHSFIFENKTAARIQKQSS